MKKILINVCKIGMLVSVMGLAFGFIVLDNSKPGSEDFDTVINMVGVFSMMALVSGVSYVVLTEK